MSQDLLTIKLEKQTYGGAALGRLQDGRAVFVPFALPGETVRLRVVDEKRGHVRANLVEVLDPAPGRIAARCRHFGACGGCHYQHLAYPDQLTTKAGILREQLERIGRIASPPLEEIVVAGQEWNYRNHVQFHLSRDGKLGFVDAEGHSVLPVSECHLPEPALNSLWPRLDFSPGLDLERVSLRLGVEDETLLVLESGSNELPSLELDRDCSVVHLNNADLVVMAGDDHLLMNILDRMFRVSAASFFQVNSEMAGKMVTHLMTHLPVSADGTLLDVYCGVGLFSAFLAPRVGRLIGIESSPSACEDFAANLDEFNHVELYQAEAEKVLPGLDCHPQAAILDPPRAGLEKAALDALLKLGPQVIAYVSCDPSTLSRDAARLISGGYQLKRVTPFDMFPQTYHIESISFFEKG